MNYRMINNHVAEELSLSETYTYLILALKSDYETYKSAIKQSTLSDMVGLCENQLREHLDKMKTGVYSSRYETNSISTGMAERNADMS